MTEKQNTLLNKKPHGLIDRRKPKKRGMFMKVKEGVALGKEMTKEERYVNGGWPGKKVHTSEP